MNSLLRLRGGLVAVALLLAASTVQAAPAPDEPGAAKVDKYLPDDAGGVFVVDVKQILASKAFTKELKKQLEDLLKMDQVQMVLKDTGFDPFKDVDRVILAITPGADGMSGPFLIVEGRFDAKKLETKAEELAKQFPIIKPVEIGKSKMYEINPGHGNPAYLGLLDKGTFVLSDSKQEITEAVEKAGGKKKTEFKSKNLGGLIAKMDPKLAVNVACAGEMATGGSAMSVPGGGFVRMVRTLADEGIDSVTGGIAVNEDAKGKIHFVARDADVAKKLAAEFEAGIAQAQKEIAREAVRNEHLLPVVEVVKTFKTSLNEQTITVEGQGTAASAEALVKAFLLEFGGAARPTAPPAAK
jgi:copper chaperone CopZ